jgi:hypothetical protein
VARPVSRFSPVLPSKTPVKLCVKLSN